jgi:hypothetical protein
MKAILLLLCAIVEVIAHTLASYHFQSVDDYYHINWVREVYEWVMRKSKEAQNIYLLAVGLECLNDEKPLKRLQL